MKREEILNEMKAALERYKTIKEKEFNFDSFVREFKHDCGTVCCLWGWEPKFGVLPVKWDFTKDLFISIKPENFLGWGYLIIRYLYYPEVTSIHKITGIELNSEDSLSSVLRAWERAIHLIETTNELDEFLNIRSI